MRFWITMCIGIALISGFSSGMYVYYPEAFGFEKAEPLLTNRTEEPASNRELPLFEFDRVKDEIDKVPQFTEGTSVFHLRNDGKGDLRLQLGTKSCTCAAIRIDRDGKPVIRFAKSRELEDAEEKLKENRRDSVSDAVEGMGNIDPSGKTTLKPGETADFVIEWDSRDSIGVKTVTGSVLSDDERSNRREVEFVLRMNVYPDLVVEPDGFSFGQLRDGQERQESIRLYSLVHEDLTIAYESSSSPAITVEVRPMTEEEAARTKAKAGFVATATVKGQLPVGDYLETVTFHTSLPKQPQRRVIVTGFVNGKIEVHPGRVNFGTVPRSGGAKKRVSISAPILGDGEVLRVDEKLIQTEPAEDIVGATISRQKDFNQVWMVEIFIKPNHHVGRFKSLVPIVDSAGQPRATITVEGNIAGGGGSN